MGTNTIVSIGGTGNLPTTNELVVDMSKKRWQSFPQLTPLTVIMSRAEHSKAHNFRVDLIEEHEMPTEVEIAATESTAGASISVKAYGTTLVKDTLLYNPRTDDLRIVDSTPAANDVTVTIDQGGTTSSAWQTGDIVHVMLPALVENDNPTSTTFRAASVTDTNVYNFVQIAKLQFAITRLENSMTSHFGGPGEKRMRLKQQKYREFRVKGEKLKMFGGRASGGTAPASRRMQGGLVHFLRNGTLAKDFNGTFTESGWDNMLGDYLDQNPDAKNIAAPMAPNVIRQINYFAKDKIRISPMSKKYGLDLTRYIGGPMEVDLIPLPLLTDPVTRGWGWLLDFSRIRLKDIDPPTYYPDAFNVGESEVIYDTYREVTSMLLANESRHLQFTGAIL